MTTGAEDPGSMELALFEGCPDAVLAFDRAGVVVYRNPAATHLLGTGSDELLGLPLEAIVQFEPGDASGHYPERMWALGRNRVPVPIPIPVEIVTWEVQEDPLITRCILLHDARTTVAHEAEQAVATESLRRQTRLDPLTGLSNRFELDERSAAPVAESTRRGRAASADETVARLGGDEFVVLAMVERGSDADSLVQRVHTALRGDITTTAGPLRIDTSLGGALADPGETVSDVIRRADRAMYRRKAGIPHQGGDAGPAPRKRAAV